MPYLALGESVRPVLYEKTVKTDTQRSEVEIGNQPKGLSVGESGIKGQKVWDGTERQTFTLSKRSFTF